MVRHAKDKKRRSGRSRTKLKNRSWVRYDPKPKVAKELRKVWDPSLSAAKNLASLGLLGLPNQRESESSNSSATVTSSQSSSSSASKTHKVIELFDVPDSDRPSRATRFPLTQDEEEYMARCMAKHGDDYLAMFRDLKTNNMQHTEERLRKMGARFLLLTSEQRRVPVPERVKHLLQDNGP